MAAPRTASAYDAAGLDPNVVGAGSLSVQIEVRNEEELREALDAGAEAVLLDNIDAGSGETLRATGAESSTRLRDRDFRRNNTAQCACLCGDCADFLSSGALTHSAPGANLSLLVESVR